MRVQGLHLLLTYKCNARCRHCFLSAGPDRKEIFSTELVLKILEDARDISSINHLFIEGGEPFLYQDLMCLVVGRATESGYWVGALTNGFWAVSEKRATEALKPLAAAGLKSLSVSTDAWHEEFVSSDRAWMAANAARSLGLETDVMVCRDSWTNSKAQVEVDKIRKKIAPTAVYASGVVCRGRAAMKICLNGTKSWDSFESCGESLAEPGRVHIGPSGEIHLCQGLLIGHSAKTKTLKSIFDIYRLNKHPVVASLIDGGPAGLARFAVQYGWRNDKRYHDGCQLCFEVRLFLKDRFPLQIGPPEIYAA